MFNTKREPLFHLVKRIDVSKKYAWAIRIGAFLLSILVCAAVSALLTEKSMGFFFKYLINGTFGTKRTIWNLFHETAILLLVSIAVTPCFKMKFWNIGGEGQILMGALGCSVALVFMGGQSSDGVTIFVSLVLAFAFGIAWAVIPAFFKARWNTNETLLTLMMNYIAICLVNYFIKSVASSSTGTLTFKEGLVEPLGGNQYILFIIVAVVLTVLMWVYLKYSKHGYELTVVGESENTSRYVGINNKLVIIRTLILCGALCGLIGFLLVSGVNHSLGDATVEGRGFTGLLISWLAHFNPLAMGLVSFLFVFIDNGSSQVSNYARLGASYPKVMTGIFFFFIIATEFFINYRIVFKKKKVKEITDNGDTISGETEPMKDEIETDKDNTKENINEEIVKEKV
jgi:simple sugar transport system permease protein